MKICIIGGSGFIGTQLVSSLLGVGHEVVIADKNPSKAFPKLFVPCDVRDVDSLISVMKGCDAVYNLAAEHADNVSPISLYYDVNVEGAKNTIKAMEVNGIQQLVFTSSVALYGFAEEASTEDTMVAPFNDYGHSKFEAEQVYEGWQRSAADNKLVMIRPCVVFGEGNRGNVYNLFRQLCSGTFIMIGKGHNKKSMAYVENVVGALTWALERTAGIHIYNYADTPDLTARELVIIAKEETGRSAKVGLAVPYVLGLIGGYAFDILSKVTGRKFSISSIRIKKFCSDTQVSAGKIFADGYKASVSLPEGIRRMIKSEFGS